MTATFTPGPWTLETVRTVCGICHMIGPFPSRSGAVGDKPRHACLYADYPSVGNPRDAELEANARLIAAAPDLCAALQGLLSAVQASVCEGSGPAQDAAAEALHKAVGGAP